MPIWSFKAKVFCYFCLSYLAAPMGQYMQYQDDWQSNINMGTAMEFLEISPAILKLPFIQQNTFRIIIAKGTLKKIISNSATKIVPAEGQVLIGAKPSVGTVMCMRPVLVNEHDKKIRQSDRIELRTSWNAFDQYTVSVSTK